MPPGPRLPHVVYRAANDRAVIVGNVPDGVDDFCAGNRLVARYLNNRVGSEDTRVIKPTQKQERAKERISDCDDVGEPDPIALHLTHSGACQRHGGEDAALSGFSGARLRLM